MAWFPGAIRRPITKHNRLMAAYNRVNLHVAVSEASSLFGYFNRGDVWVVSHFYVRKDGTVEQYVDTAYRAAADLEGNDATISVETQGGVNDAQGEPWTQAQVNACAAIFAWAVKNHGIERRLAQDSRLGATSKGLSWHRLGIDPWRVDGGMKYSNSRGKVCPGNAKIAQIPTVLARATATLTGATTTVPDVTDVPELDLPAPLNPLDLPTEDDMERAIEGFYEKFLGRKASRGEVNDQLAFAAEHGLKVTRDGIANSAEGKAFAALPATEQATRRAKAQTVPAAVTSVMVGTVEATIEGAVIETAIRNVLGSLKP